MRKKVHPEKKMQNVMGSPPYHDATPPRMHRSGGSSKSGNNWHIPNTAKYGLGEGQPPTRMDRHVPAGKTGNNFEIPNKGPGRASRKDTGANSSQGAGYGVNGVQVSTVGMKRPNHGGRYGGGGTVAGDTGRYGGS